MVKDAMPIRTAPDSPLSTRPGDRPPTVLVVTDAWRPQLNGVVHTLEELARSMAEEGVEVVFLTPEKFATVPLPSYPEIRLAITSKRQVLAEIEAIAPDYIHIATEGPLGMAARRACLQRRLPFTPAYHTGVPPVLRPRP